MYNSSFSRSVGQTLCINNRISETLCSLMYISPSLRLLLFSSLLCLKEPQRWTGRKWSTAACAFTMESLRTSTGENIATMFNMLPIVSIYVIIQLIFLFQLSQFEDSRREDRDLSSTSQVRLQHLWRHWRRGSHYQVCFECRRNRMPSHSLFSQI